LVAINSSSPQTGLTPAGCPELAARLHWTPPPFQRPSYWTHGRFGNMQHGCSSRIVPRFKPPSEVALEAHPVSINHTQPAVTGPCIDGWSEFQQWPILDARSDECPWPKTETTHEINNQENCRLRTSNTVTRGGVEPPTFRFSVQSPPVRSSTTRHFACRGCAVEAPKAFRELELLDSSLDSLIGHCGDPSTLWRAQCSRSKVVH
jgi:hypothetical protein